MSIDFVRTKCNNSFGLFSSLLSLMQCNAMHTDTRGEQPNKPKKKQKLKTKTKRRWQAHNRQMRSESNGTECKTSTFVFEPNQKQQKK